MPIIRWIFNRGFLFFMFLIVVACSFKSLEIIRLSNPSNEIDAIIALRETDTTVATPTEICLVQIQSKISGEPVFRADRVDGLRVFWEGDRVLKVRADKARVFLKLLTQDFNVKNQHNRVEIKYEILQEE